MAKSSEKLSARERILQTAQAAFSIQGYARTTTQTIAEQADVAEVTLFRHFGNKFGLFTAVVEQITGAVAFDAIANELVNDPRTDLVIIGQHILTYFTEQRETIAMLLLESSHFPEMQDALAQKPREAVMFLTTYFADQINAGNLKPHEPLLLAQSFVSLLFGYALALAPMQATLPAPRSNQAVIEQFVQILLDGIST
jgi:AcrR family transcriptional regulator